MRKYIMGLLKNIFNPAVSLLAQIDHYSKVSKEARIHRGAKVFRSNIGSYTYITQGSSVIYADVGKFCSVGHHSLIGLAHHTLDKLSTSPLFTERNNATRKKWIEKSTEFPYRKVIIGNDVWVGSRVMILGGINIGDGAVIAAGAIVTKDVPPYAIVAGVPARLIRYRFDQKIINKLLEIQWWNFSQKHLKNRIKVFSESQPTLSILNQYFPYKNLDNK